MGNFTDEGQGEYRMLQILIQSCGSFSCKLGMDMGVGKAIANLVLVPHAYLHCAYFLIFYIYTLCVYHILPNEQQH